MFFIFAEFWAMARRSKQRLDIMLAQMGDHLIHFSLALNQKTEMIHAWTIVIIDMFICCGHKPEAVKNVFTHPQRLRIIFQ